MVCEWSNCVVYVEALLYGLTINIKCMNGLSVCVK